MTAIEDALDKILHKFASCGYPHPSYRVYCEWCDNLPQAKQDIINLIETEIIGEDEPHTEQCRLQEPVNGYKGCTCHASPYNSLREKQRKKLNATKEN